MRRYFMHLTAAAIAAAAFAFVPAVRAADQPANAPAAQPAAQAANLPAGVEARELKDPKGILDAFGDITNAAFGKGVFDDVSGRLVNADRDRVRDWKDKNVKDLEDRAMALDRQWKEKYGKDAKLDVKNVFGTNGFVAITLGQIVDPNQLIGHWPLQAVAQNEARTASERQPAVAAPADTEQQRRDANKLAGGKTKLEKSRLVAIAIYPASHNLPALTLSMVHENIDSWRFDIPDNIDGKTLHDNLLKQLDMLSQNSSKWPSDVNDGYRMVAHHILMAMYDVEAPANGQHQ
jgi:hypothetical protein